jgi:hypothetical protein
VNEEAPAHWGAVAPKIIVIIIKANVQWSLSMPHRYIRSTEE